MSALIAVGIVNLACDAIARSTGVARSRLLEHAALDELLLRDPDAMVDMAALVSLLRFALAHTGDPAIGLRLARVLDLREQGFWGYAVLSSGSLRERVDVHIRYQELRAPWQLAFSAADGVATFEVIPREVPADVLPILMDWVLATALLHLASHLGQKPRGVRLQLGYAEGEHHRAFTALFEGEIACDAPCTCLRAPITLLDLSLPGDPKLGQLVRRQLDARLRDVRRAPRALIERVRERLAARLDRDASLARVARDLNISTRTLQRQLEAEATSFDALLEEVRRTHALRYMNDTAQSVQRVAAALGYADASSFRRAFRRWTGLAPAQFRVLARHTPKTARKVSVA